MENQLITKMKSIYKSNNCFTSLQLFIEKTLNRHLYTACRFPEETIPFFILEYYGELSFEIYLRSVFERRLLRMNLDFDDVVLNGFTLKKIVKICSPLMATIYGVARSYFRRSTYQRTIYCDVRNTKYIKETEDTNHKS